MIKNPHTGQTAYLFVPGKNWKLSLAELVSFLTARKHSFEIRYLSKSFFIITSEKVLDPSLANDLGGIIKIGRVVSQIPAKTMIEAFPLKEKEAKAELRASLTADRLADEIFEKPIVSKCLFGVSLYFDNPRLLRFSQRMQRFIGSYFKEELSSQGIRAKFMGIPRRRVLPQLTHVEVIKKGLVEKSAEILLCIGRNYIFLSKTIGVHNPFEFQKETYADQSNAESFPCHPDWRESWQIWRSACPVWS